MWAKSSKEVIDDKLGGEQKPNEPETVVTDINANSAETQEKGQEEIEELKQIINDPNSSDEDKQSAQELIDELEQSNNE